MSIRAGHRPGLRPRTRGRDVGWIPASAGMTGAERTVEARVYSVIPEKACHDQGICPRCRARNFGGVRARRASTPVIPLMSGIHEKR